ncbi:gluconokinase [Actinomadura vinacea]|uniref:Gluconokinase n=1 Tax=Actinomadura vinacea TaxID=115336 RepID=A0ABN3JMQ2_9ACTN
MAAPHDPPAPTVIVVAGVSGSGKSTVGEALAGRLGWEYAEADDFHSPANIAKMSAGVPLTDEDRLPWLRAIAGWIGERVEAADPGVVTCSALKRSYRKLLAGGRPEVRLVLLDGDRDMIARRMRARSGHFFKPGLLDSQFRDLERPGPDEHVLTVPVAGSPEEIVTRVLDGLGLPR